MLIALNLIIILMFAFDIYLTVKTLNSFDNWEKRQWK